MKPNPKEDDKAGTIRLIGAASILFGCVLGWFLDPMGNPMLSAGLIGGAAAVSFAARGLFNRNRG